MPGRFPTLRRQVDTAPSPSPAQKLSPTDSYLQRLNECAIRAGHAQEQMASFEFVLSHKALFGQYLTLQVFCLYTIVSDYVISMVCVCVNMRVHMCVCVCACVHFSCFFFVVLFCLISLV
jgi:hypothetical protein